MAIAIGRTAWTDDDGSGTTGTVLNNAMKTGLYDEIDAVLNATRAQHLLFTDATYDIGATGATRPRDLFLSRNAVIGGVFYVAGTAYVGDTENAKATLGLTINQGAADDEALAVKSSDVAHGMTDFVETDTYFEVKKVEATNGGALLRGFSEGSYGMLLIGEYTTDTATRSTSGIAPILFDVNLKSGTSHVSPAADKNIAAFQAGGATRFILDSDGDSFQDVGTAWTNFDAHDDALVLESLAMEVSQDDDPWKARIRENFASALDVLMPREAMQAMKLVTFNDDGHHFVNMSKLTMLHTGAIRQLAREVRRMPQMVARLAALEQRMLA